MTESNRNRTLLFTGKGKGKTTAALGMAVRAAGHDMRTAVVQFIKSNSNTGEIAALRHVPGIEIIQAGLGFLPPKGTHTFTEHRHAAQAGLELTQQLLTSGDWDMIVLDEIAYAVAKGLLEEYAVIQAVHQAAPEMIVVMTGRFASVGLVELADTVTEMRPVKHAFETGWKAQPGVEY